MYAYKEVLTLDDLQHITLKRPLSLKKGQKVELLILVDNESEDLDSIRNHIEQQNLTETDVQQAINWARET